MSQTIMREKHTPTEKFQFEYLKPIYWGKWCLFVLLWLIMWLPRKWVMGLGVFVGDQIRTRSAKRRHIAEINIRLCFPELSAEQQAEMVLESFRNYGCGLVDMGLTMIGTRRRLAKYSDIDGFEYIAAKNNKQNRILITYHTTTVDMCSASMLNDVDLVSIMKRDPNPLMNWFLYRSRARYKKAKIIMRDHGLRGVIDGIKQGRLCFFIPDEDFGEGKHTTFAPFFGQRRATINTVSRIAKLTNAVVIPCICRLIRNTGRYRTTVLPALDGFPSGDDAEDTARMNQVMEDLIRQAPDQYLWTFRWFRTQEDGMQNPYD